MRPKACFGQFQTDGIGRETYGGLFRQSGSFMGGAFAGHIVESHGGRLWAANNSPGGASFYLTLPAKFEARA